MLKILELFAGYGSQALALENLGLEFTSDISEIDKYAIEAYNQIHGQTKNYGDVCNINEAELPDYDLITYSSPCQDFSVAGKMKGGQKGSGTRSSLLWECERIISAVKPKYLLMENVKNLVGKKFMPCFKSWLCTLEELGYNNYWKVLNAKNYGVPQNRERVFVVSIRKDLNQTYTFPEPVPLTLKLKDLLETEVDERYYLPQEKVEKLALNLNKDVSNTIRCGGGGSLDGKHTWDVVIAASRGRNPEAGLPTEQRMEVNSSGVSNTLTTVQKDNLVVEPKINVLGNYKPSGNECGRIVGVEGVSPTIKDNHGAVYSIAEPQVKFVGNVYDNNYNSQAGRVYDAKGLSHCLDTMGGGNRQPKVLEDGICIRKLTPRECWRLMGVKDEQFDRLNGISKNQLYKMAGNSIVVNVIMAIFKNLLISDKETKGQLYLL